MDKMTVKDAEIAGKKVLVRVDFNVPIGEGEVTDTTRIRAAIPTLEYILDQNPKVLILISHLGRPKGEKNLKYSLAPVAPVLAELMNRPVKFVEDCIGEVANNAVKTAKDGEILLLENTRFYPGETKNHTDFANQLAQLADIFVNDAFGTAHRAHGSNVGVAEHLPAYAGMLMEKEIDYLGNAIENPASPFIAILGGAKVSDKIAVIEALLDKVDALLIGGGMANTFAAAQGYNMADSLVEAEVIDVAKDLIEKGGDKLILPIDVVIGNKFGEDADTDTILLTNGIPAGWAAYDIGIETIKRFEQKLKTAKTVVWNGPMGVFELSPFSGGTNAVANALALATENGAITIIGGGDSAAAVEKAGLAGAVSHVSTGGGASLEMLEGKILPGLAAIQDKQ